MSSRKTISIIDIGVKTRTSRNVSKKRVKQELSVAQTLNAGILEKSASIRKDESILVHIEGRDCVAIEVQYHERCYQMYTKILTRTPKIKGPTLYDKAFDIFCEEVVEERIKNGGEVLLLSYLLKKVIMQLC